jgi:hypothetical protein
VAIAGNLLSANAESIETDASAWAAVLNATGLARGSGGTLGSFCLVFKPTAVGDCQVGLAARVAVTPGSTYLAYASVWAAVAGGVSRVELKWYNAGGTLLSTTSGTQVSPAAPSWNQNAVVGVAPATAATVNVIIRVTGTVAGQSWFADRVYLGPVPDVADGNLFDWPTQDMEVDATSWSAVANSTLSLSTTSAYFYQSMRMASVAAGAASMRTAAAAPVTAATEYMAYAYVLPGTAGLTTTIQIQWLDSLNAVISTSSHNWTPPTGAWTRVVVIDTAPAGAVSARVTLVGVATGAGQTWTVDRVVLTPTSGFMGPGNMFPYNTSGMEQDTSGWTVAGGAATQTTEQTWSGVYAMKLVATGGTPMTATAEIPLNRIVPDRGHQFVTFIRRGAGAADGSLYETRINWVDGDGVVTRTRWQTWNSGNAVGWQIGTMADIAPLDAVSATVEITVKNPTAGEVWYTDHLFFGLGGLTVQAAEAPGGGAALTVRGLTTVVPTWTWELHRLLPGKAPQPVRGWDGDLVDQPIIGDAAVITDYEAPLGIPVAWRVTLNDDDSPSSFSYTCDPITLPAEELDVWLKDPGVPARSVRATVGTPLPTWTRPVRRGINQVHGRARPVIINDVRGSRSGDLVLVTETKDERDALWWVLNSGGPLLLQWPPGWGQEDMYVSVGDVPEAPITDLAEHMDRTWSLPLTEVDRPIGGIAGSADRTWQTVKDSGDTWTDALSGALSWLGVYTGTGI